MTELFSCAQVIFRYFLLEVAGSAIGLYFLHLLMDLSETLGESPKMNILFSCLIVIFRKNKKAKTEKSEAAWNTTAPTTKSCMTGSMKAKTFV